MRIRKLRIFTFFFVVLVLCAVYGLALLRTYTFKAPSGTTSLAPGVVQCAADDSFDRADPNER